MHLKERDTNRNQWTKDMEDSHTNDAPTYHYIHGHIRVSLHATQQVAFNGRLNEFQNRQAEVTLTHTHTHLCTS